jgi:Xaa-Pro aminopeptidase
MKRQPIANVDRLHRLMDANGLDAVIARSGVNFTYLSGVTYPGTLARHLDLPESPRPVFVMWPRKGEPVILLNPLADQLTRRDSWVERVVVYASYTETPLDRLCEILREAGLADGRIGYEENYFSVSQLAAMAKALPKARLSDCTAMLDEVRWIKTPGEIDLIKRGADVLDEAFLEVFSTLKDGETERSAPARLVASSLQRGAAFAHGWMASGRNTVPAGGQSDLAFRRGDIVRTDYVSYLNGYPGHQSRQAVLGNPSAEQAHNYQRVRDVYLATIERCRPGVGAGELYDFTAERFKAAGLPFKAALVGHSVGCWWHQQEPILAHGNPMKIEAGMVIALEPYVDEWVTQDMFLITDDGPRLLSDRFKTDEIYRIPL